MSKSKISEGGKGWGNVVERCPGWLDKRGGERFQMFGRFKVSARMRGKRRLNSFAKGNKKREYQSR